jgi:hypothetical protein
MLKQYFFPLIITSTLAGCGGSSTSPTPSPYPTVPTSPTSSTTTTEITGVITGFGSVYINGVEYETESAEVSTDDNAGASETDLQIGMVITLNGEINDDGTTGSASSIHYDEQIKGPLDSIDLISNSLSVLGQTILFDDLTSLDNAILTALIPGDFLEISGFFDADGNLYATRIEKETESSQLKVQGIVETLDTVNKTFTLSSLTIDYSSAIFDDFVEADLANNLEVRVKGLSSALTNEIFVVSEIKLKDSREDHEDGDDKHIEGFITRFNSSSSFIVKGIHVITDENTEFEHGSADSLLLNIRVKIKGEFNASSDLLAKEIRIHQRTNLNLEGAVQEVDLDLKTVTVLDVVFEISSQTKMKDESDTGARFFDLADLTVGDFVEIKGFIDNEGHNIATKMKRENENKDDEHETKLQGTVSNIIDFSFDIVGVNITTDEGTKFEGIDGNNVTQGMFFEQLQDDLLVEVKGQIVEGVFVAFKVEIEANDSDEDTHRIELRGIVEDTANETLVVSGHDILITSNTAFEVNDDEFSADQFWQIVTVDDQVKVKGFVDEQGVITAKSIELEY